LHVLTKIFVVFASFLSVLLVALTVAYASNAGKIVSEVEGLRTENRSLSQQRALDNATRDETLRSIEVEREQLRDQLVERNKEILDLQQEAANLRADLAEAKHEADRAESEITQLAAANNTMAAVNDRLTSEVDRRREEQLALERRNIELQDQINDLSSQLQVAESLNRKYEEQLAAGERGGEDGEDADQTIPPVQVFGRVTSVRRLETGETLVQIDLGSSDQLREGHELYIVRGGDYIGTIQLQNVDVNASVGRVIQLRTGREIQVEDNVQSPVTR
jgi:nitrogen fixation protein FixH